MTRGLFLIRGLLTFAMLSGVVHQVTPSARADGGTSVGGGGDPLYFFLENSRSKLVLAVNKLIYEPDTRAYICNGARLTDEQKSFCLKFILETAIEFTQINAGTNKIKFIIRDTPLIVTGPDGTDINVVARTPLGPTGDVEFYRPMLKNLSPPDLLMLLGHEFGHKVTFEGVNIGDNNPVGPFATGREFLDTLGDAIKSYALKYNLIGHTANILDQYSCSVRDIYGRYEVRSALNNQRTFNDENLTSYHTGLGYNEAPTTIELFEAAGTKVKMQIVITEPESCHDNPVANSRRNTVVKLIRVFPQTPEHPEYREEEITSQLYQTLNPLCTDQKIPFALLNGDTEFKCQYDSTMGGSR